MVNTTNAVLLGAIQAQIRLYKGEGPAGAGARHLPDTEVRAEVNPKEEIE
jgi:hypothetical protein